MRKEENTQTQRDRYTHTQMKKQKVWMKLCDMYQYMETGQDLVRGGQREEYILITISTTEKKYDYQSK